MKRAAVPSILVAAVLLGLGVIAEAQQPKRVPLIGILGSSSISGAARSQAIRRALGELGYIDGQNITIEERYRVQTPDRRPRDDFAMELVRRKVDIIVVAGGDEVVRAALMHWNQSKTTKLLLARAIRRALLRSERGGPNYRGLWQG